MLNDLRDNQPEEMVVVGCLEPVSLPELGIKNQLAKIDTGAFSGALHCTDIEFIDHGGRPHDVLRFVPSGAAGRAVETTDFFRTYVRSATGHRVRRYLIDTKIIIKGKEYPIRIGLSDRSDMRRKALVGRRFLREQRMLVDVNRNREFDNEKESK